jgi:drug/metabolite transporter (DMT)-like permease
MTARRTKTKAVLSVAAAAVLFSTGGTAIKTAAFSAMQIASMRSGVAAAMLLLWFGNRVEWTPRVVAIGLVYAATLLLFVAATKLTTAASAIFLQSAAPLYVALIGPLVLRERLHARDFAVLAAVAIGLACCLAAGTESSLTAPDPWTGNLLGALCGVAWAFTLLGLRWGARADRDLAVSAVIAGNLFAFVAGVPALWPLPTVAPAEWATLAYLGIFQIGVAYILLTRAMRDLAALQVSLFLLLEPALNPLWAWLVQGEVPSGLALAGGAVILVASGTKAFMDAVREQA